MSQAPIILSRRLPSGEHGQILPLAAVLLALLTAFLLALSQFILNTQRSTVRFEEDFQRLFSNSLSVANKLNAISVNNQHIALTLDRVFKIYLSGSGHALDLAASTPLWERSLPVPIPERVYAAFEATLPGARMQLAAIQSMNDSLISQIPRQIRERLTRTSVTDSLCKVASATESSQSTDNCRYRLTQSMFGFPHLRTVSGATAFAAALQQKYGFVLIKISDDIFLKRIATDRRRGDFEDPFARQTIALTHARFCADKSELKLKKHCPKTTFPEGFPGSLARSREVISFEPHWSVLVDDN